MRILFIDGDDELDAMLFEERFPDLEDVAAGVAEKGGVMQVEDAGGDFAVTLYLYEFGDVDPAFIDFMIENYVDYDVTKGKNFHVLEETE